MKGAVEAIATAKVDVANAERDGDIGESDAVRERTIRVAENEAQAEKGRKAAEADQRIFVQEQEAVAVSGENESRARIAETNANLAEAEATARQRSEVAQRLADVKIQQAQFDLETERLRAEEIAREEIAKQQIVIASEAEAERQRQIARGEADAILAKYNAEAEGTEAVLAAKARGYEALVQAANGDARSAATLLMVEKLESIVAQQAKATSPTSRSTRSLCGTPLVARMRGPRPRTSSRASTRASLPSMTSPAWQESTSRTTSARWLRRPRPSETVRHR